MSMQSTRRAFLSAMVAAAVAAPLVGCDSGEQETVKEVQPYEGKYVNAKGDTVLEITDHAVIFTNPATRQRSEVPYSADGNKLSVESDVGIFTLTFNPDGTITGLPPAVAGGTAPLKKAP